MVRIAFARARFFVAATPLLVMGLLLSLLSGCGASQEILVPSTTAKSETTSTLASAPTTKPSAPSTVAPPTTAIASGPLAGRTKPEPGKVAAPVTALVTEDLIVGTGEAAAAVGSIVDVHYVGALIDGTEFDASWAKPNTFTFGIGSGQVIKGWDAGVTGMRVGGRRRLVIPPELAYGATAKAKIPANSTLVFVVDLAKVSTEPPVTPDATLAPGLTKLDLVEGTGPEVKLGDSLTINFVLVSATTGKKLFSSWQAGRSTTIKLGEGKAIRGWDEGLVGMKVGGRRRLSIPPSLAYGETGNGDIGPNETLLYIVDLLARQPG